MRTETDMRSLAEQHEASVADALDQRIEIVRGHERPGNPSNGVDDLGPRVFTSAEQAPEPHGPPLPSPAGRVGSSSRPMWRANHVAANRATSSSAPGSSNKCVAF